MDYQPLIALSKGHNQHAQGAEQDGVTEFSLIEPVVDLVKKQFEDWGIRHLLYVPKLDHLSMAELLADSGKRKELAATIKFINQRNVKVAVELHFNKHRNKDVHGCEVFHYRQSVEGERLAKFVSGRLTEWLPPSVVKDDTQTYIYERYGYPLGFLKYTKMPAILIEGGYMSNSKDFSQMKDNPDKLARVLSEALVGILEKFLGVDCNLKPS